MDKPTVFYLSLFSGACGGDLAYQHLLGWRCAGYVEIERYCQQVIAQRIKDGLLDEAPIFSDIRDFIDQGYAESYKGLVDGITAGFPCQPFSIVGRRKGGKDKRNMWPATIECIRIIRPRFAFLENVPGLRSHPYIMQIFGDLAEAGYDARWCVLGADDVGAPHRRKRLWILTYLDSQGFENFTRLTTSQEKNCIRKAASVGNSQNDYERLIHSRWWEVEPHVVRVVYGVANGVDRLKALGNGQVPLCAAVAWKILSGLD